MTAETKGNQKVLEFVIGQLRLARRASNPYEAAAAVSLEIELTNRVEALKRGEPMPDGQSVQAEPLPALT